MHRSTENVAVVIVSPAERHAPYIRELSRLVDVVPGARFVDRESESSDDDDEMFRPFE